MTAAATIHESIDQMTVAKMRETLHVLATTGLDLQLAAGNGVWFDGRALPAGADVWLITAGSVITNVIRAHR